MCVCLRESLPATQAKVDLKAVKDQCLKFCKITVVPTLLMDCNIGIVGI